MTGPNSMACKHGNDSHILADDEHTPALMACKLAACDQLADGYGQADDDLLVDDDPAACVLAGDEPVVYA
jgi:hypothetical protein